MTEEKPSIEHEPISKAAQQIFSIVQQYLNPDEVKLIWQAIQLILDSCGDIRSDSFISLQANPLAIACILTEMHVDAIVIAAGLVFELVYAEILSIEHVKSVLGPKVAHVVGSTLFLDILERKRQSVSSEGKSKAEVLRRRQAETVRKMFFAMSEDPRVILLKLAYRLHAMRLIQAASYPIDHQEILTMAQETREIYAPLAGRLGMSRVKSELEDLAFEILEPEKYTWIRNQVEEEKKRWRSYVDRICTILRQEMTKLGLRAEVSGRVKHLYSFYKKLRRNAGNVERLEDLKAAADFSQIQDLVAFRVLVESLSDCYVVLGHVHSLWKPKEGWIKDYIANPKLNGYRSLHTTVFCLDDQLAEIQIRTFAMHEMAEYGIAPQENNKAAHPHWYYKDASTSRKDLPMWLRRLADWQRDLRSLATSDTEFIEAVKDDIFQEQIFVFTPKGEVKDLPVGSTPLDFAYRVHSKVGDRCAGAHIITGEGSRLVTRMVPLDYELRSGDIVDIVTSRTAHPTRDWLNFARTAAARSKIRRYLKIHERAINIQIGRECLDRELKIMGARDVDILSEDNQNWLANEFRQASFEDVLAAIGGDDIRPHAAAVKLVERWQQLRERRDGKEAKDESLTPLPLPAAPKQASSARLQVAGVSGLLTRLANCCCPLPGDEIVGFISRDKGAIVHRVDCRYISRYRERDRERLINVSWTSMGQQRYLAPILITARDRSGSIRDIATVVSEAGVNMTSVGSTVGSGQQMVLINAMLEIESLEQLHWVFSRLEKVKDVLHVERDLGKKPKI